MKKIDKDGLLLCNLQGNVFTDSIKNTSCSSEIFIRRFMTSTICKEFDSLAILDDTLTIFDVISEVEKEFGKINYGKIKYHKEVMFWIGYIYRYFAYTYDLSSKYVYKLVKPKELYKLYYVYHTFDPAAAIERILEEKNISFNFDNQNERLLKMLRNMHYERDITLEKMTKESADSLICDFMDDWSLVKDEFSISEYVYLKEKVDSCVGKKENDGYTLLVIKYKDEIIGVIYFVKIDLGTHQLGIVLKNDKYKNKGMGTISIKKSLQYAKNQKINSVVAKISKDNQRAVAMFKKIGFTYDKEDCDFVYFKKNI